MSMPIQAALSDCPVVTSVPFPIGSLSPGLRALVQGLLARHQIAPGPALMAILGIGGAAAGASILLDADGLTVMPRLNLIFVSNRTAFQSLLDEMAAPLLAAQASLARSMSGPDPGWRDAETSRIRRERLNYLERFPASFPQDLRYFDEPLAALDLARWPAIVTDSLATSVHLQTLLLTSPAQTVAAIERWAGQTGDSAVTAPVHGFPGDCAGGMSAIMVAGEADLARLFGPELGRVGLADRFVVVRDEPVAVEGCSVPPQWVELLHRLWAWRLTGQTAIVRPTHEAQEILDAWRQAGGVDPGAGRGRYPLLVYPIALAIHLATLDAQDLTAKTALAAVELVAWLTGQRPNIVTPAPPATRDVILEFVDQMIENHDGGTATEAECYEAYRVYCEDLQLVPLTRARFKKAAEVSIVGLGGTASTNIPRPGPERITLQRGWRHVRLKSPVQTVSSCLEGPAAAPKTIIES